MDFLQNVPPLGRRIHRLLMQARTRQLQAELHGGVYAALKIQGSYHLSHIAFAPANAHCRWWLFWVLCGRSPAKEAARWGFSRLDVDIFACMTRLFCAGPANSATRLALKIRNVLLNYDETCAVFELLDERFAAEKHLYRQARAAGRPRHAAELTLSPTGMPKGGKGAKIKDELLQLCIRNPQLNRRDVLQGISKQLKKVL